jgi:hypothetical protein
MNQNQEQKIYAPVSAKKVTFQSGKSILKIGINVEKFKAFLDTHRNTKGYVNLGISERKETGQYGETHTVWLDTWQPDAAKASPRQTPEPAAPTPSIVGDFPPENDDVPF